MSNTENPTNDPNTTAAHPASEPRDLWGNEYSINAPVMTCKKDNMTTYRGKIDDK